MASLSKEMRSKREIKRTSSLLIVDKDMGNVGLYKSILSMEYETEYVFSLEEAHTKINEKQYDAIILDDDFNEGDISSFLDDAKEKDNSQVVCLITDKANSEFLVGALCKGVCRVIPKPFTRDGLSNAIYEALKEKRQMFVKKHILIVDNDLDNLKRMKNELQESYNVTIMNCCHTGLSFIQKFRPDLIIADASMAESAGVEMCERLEKKKQDSGISLLFMTDEPNEECVLRCAKFKPEGFLVKPIEMEQLLADIERIFLVETYSKKRN